MLHKTGEIDGKAVMFTAHACHRMVEMDIPVEVIKKAITAPDRVVKGTKYADSKYHQVGKYAFAIKDEGNQYVVITALYSSDEAWTEANNQGLIGKDRVLRKNGYRRAT